MSTSDLLSSTLNWPGKGHFGMKSSVLQTTETNLVKQNMVSDHMRNHYRRLNNVRSAVDTKPPKAMVLGQKCRDRARKEMAQVAYAQSIIDDYATTNPNSSRATPRGRSSQSARFARSQPTTFRARSRSIESNRRVTRSFTMNSSVQHEDDIAQRLFNRDGATSQALTAMVAIGKLTSTERNRCSADVLDKHADFFSQPNPSEHQPRLVKRDSASFLRNNRAHYNPPRKSSARTRSATKESTKETLNQSKKEDDEQNALREQLNRSLELRNNVENKIKKAKVTDTKLKKQSDATLKQFDLTEQERLQYVRFMQEITDAILRKNLTTEAAIEKLFEIHIDRNRDNLDEVKIHINKIHRLRDLLEALKQDLGVQSSRKPNTYASVHRAAKFDNDPLPPPVPQSTRDESLILTPHSENRRLSYDLNAPFPWQTEEDSARRPTVTPRKIHETPATDSFNDDQLFTPTIKPKPRTSLQPKSDELPTLNFNKTIRKTIDNDLLLDWATVTPTSAPVPTETEKNNKDEDDEEEISRRHEEQERRARSPSPVPVDDDYGGDDFEEEDTQ